MKTKQITLSFHTNKLLNELVKKRVKEGSLVKTRQAVTSDAIIKLYEKEILDLGDD